MALHLKMRYRTVVTYKRSIALVAVTWTLSLRLYFVLVLIIIPFSFLVTSIVFAKIYSTLRRQQYLLSVQSRERRSPASLLAVSRYKKPGGYSHTLPIRACAAQRGRDFEAPDLERGIHFRGVF